MTGNIELLNVNGIECYEKDGVVYLKLETVARGLGFTKTETKNGTEYTTIRWERVFGYLKEFGFDHKWSKNNFIPENVFYRLAMKANNEVAEAFQAKVADEIIPTIRRRGAYMTEDTIDRMIADPEFGIKLLNELKKEKTMRKALEVKNSELSIDLAIAQPKAEYFDQLVDRHLLTSFRDTAKELGISPKFFVEWLLANKFIYRDQKYKLMPYENKNDGLFEVRESKNDKTGWAGTQTMVTPKGRETFRLLCLEAK